MPRTRTLILLTVILFLTSMINTGLTKEKTTWANAQWIALEKLDENQIVVPAVHGSGKELGEKCVARSIAPMFRKEFTVDKKIKSAV